MKRSWRCGHDPTALFRRALSGRRDLGGCAFQRLFAHWRHDRRALHKIVRRPLERVAVSEYAVDSRPVMALSGCPMGGVRTSLGVLMCSNSNRARFTPNTN